jgi:hypothetical protein
MTTKKNNKKKKTKKVLAGLGALAVLIGVGTAVAGANSAGGNNGSGGTSPQPPAATLDAAAQAGIGTTVRDGKFEFTITKITHARSVGDTAYGLGETAQGKYTILHITVTNIGDQSQTLDGSLQYLYDAHGKKYDASTMAGLYLNGGDNVFFNEINPGNTVHGKIAFDMPDGVTAVKAQLHDSMFSGGVTVNLK